MTKALAGYFPVLHAGYVDLLRRESFDRVVVLNDELTARIDWKRKDIRALAADDAVLALRSVLPPGTVVETGGVSALVSSLQLGRLIMLDDEVSRKACGEAGVSDSVEWRSAFLRWNGTKLKKQREVASAAVIKQADLPHKIAWDKAWLEAAKSSDWWRQVGAVAGRNGEVLVLAHNRHVPHELMPYVFGDPRMFASKGIAIEISTALHAEAAVVAEAARRGLSLYGASLYVTTFPCPPCAKLVAATGFRRLYFKEGYGMLDAEAVLRSAGVELLRVVD